MGGYVGYLDIKERSSVGFENWLAGCKRFRILRYNITCPILGNWVEDESFTELGALEDKPLVEEITAVVWNCEFEMPLRYDVEITIRQLDIQVWSQEWSKLDINLDGCIL